VAVGLRHVALHFGRVQLLAGDECTCRTPQALRVCARSRAGRGDGDGRLCGGGLGDDGTRDARSVLVGAADTGLSRRFGYETLGTALWATPRE